METKNIMIVGVGGQGSLLASKLLGRLLVDEGYDVKVSEVHGMSQRGGDVQSNLRISDQPIASDLISLGQADIIIAMEPMEALRYKHYLSKDGWVITSSNPFVNIGNYPDKDAIIAELKELGNVILIDTDELGKEHKMPKAVNMILLGAASKALKSISFDKLCQSVRTIFGAKGDAIVDMNIKALEIGRNCE
jgi:indolepyruvate ferredoxin oxidoreductase beta subunit